MKAVDVLRQRIGRVDSIDLRSKVTKAELLAALEAVDRLDELVDAVEPALGTMNYYFGPSARTLVSSEKEQAYTRIRDAVSASKETLARLRAVRDGEPDVSALDAPRYDHVKNAWVPRCPFGDLCSGCDASGGCSRVPAVLARNLRESRERGEKSLREFANALKLWNAPDDEHTRHQLRRLVEEVIEEIVPGSA